MNVKGVYEILWCVVTTAADENCVVSVLQDETGADVVIAVSLMGIVVCYENNQTSKFYRWVSSCYGVRMCDQAVLCGTNIHSFIHMACTEFNDSLPFSGASSIPLYHVLFPATVLHRLFFYPLSPRLAIYFLVCFSIYTNILACKFK